MGEILIWLAGVGIILVVGLLAGAGAAMTVTGLVCLTLFIIAAVRHLTLTRAAVNSMSRPPSNVLPDARYPVTVMVACHNEEAVVDRLVESLINLDYPRELMQIVVIDDGSTDQTLAKLRSWEARHHRILTVTHRPPGSGGGKSGALNLALRLATGHIVVVFDADHRPDPLSIRYLASRFDDPSAGAAQGRCVIANPDDSSLSSVVAVDYLGGYLINEQGRHEYAGLPSYGGANCAVRRDVLVQLGGWNIHSVTEDTDLTVRVLLAGHNVVFEPRAIDYEEAVTNLRGYWRQRHRWALGHQQVARNYFGPVMSSKRFTFTQKLELGFYLLIYHLPVVAAIGLVLSLVSPIVLPGEVNQVAVGLWPLLFYGPLIQLGTALVAIGARPSRFWLLLVYIPLFLLGLVLITKAWFDGITGRRYSWAKTARAGDVPALAAESGVAGAPIPGPARLRWPEPHVQIGEPADHPVRDPLLRTVGPGRVRMPDGVVPCVAQSRRPAHRKPASEASRARGYVLSTGMLLAGALVVYLLVERQFRIGEVWTAARSVNLLSPGDASPVLTSLLVQQANGDLLLLKNTISCSVAPLVAGILVIVTSVRRIVRPSRLVIGALAALAVMFGANVLRMSGLGLAAQRFSVDVVITLHDTIAQIFSMAFILASLLVMFAIYTTGSKTTSPQEGSVTADRSLTTEGTNQCVWW